MNRYSKTKNINLHIQYLISHIDILFSAQLECIQQHAHFQRLESSWRGLFYLVSEIAKLLPSNIKIRVLSISWIEISKDLNKTAEFDQSQLFMKIYNTEFGHPGGEPFGLLIGDYHIHHKAQNPFSSDIDTLQHLSKIASAAFVPFVTSIEPKLLGLDDFSEIEKIFYLDTVFQQKEYVRWQALRKNEDSRFLGCVLPRILLRRPSLFPEILSYVWGNAAYCFGAVAARAFAHHGWFSEMRGAREDSFGDGLVTGLAHHEEFITDICITDQQEKMFIDEGLMPLCECKYTPFAAFYDCPSLHKKMLSSHEERNVNSHLSSQLNYILCVSRFAHYLKVIARDKMGAFTNPQECEQYLQRWLRQYTAGGNNLDPLMKAKYPLRETKIQVQESHGKPGHYHCVIHIQPHTQFDHIAPFLKITTELENNEKLGNQ